METIENLIEKAYKNDKKINIKDLINLNFTKEEFASVSDLLENKGIKIEMYDEESITQTNHTDTQSALKSYLSEIKKYPLLKAEEEKELIKLYKNGSKAAREKLICSNLRLVAYIAKHYASLNENKGIETLDLIQYGNIGLIKSIEKYDLERNTRLSTCAYRYINSEILRGLDNNESTIRIPVHIKGILNRFIRFQKEFETKYGKEPNIDDYVNELGFDLETINYLFELPRIVQSLDFGISFDENGVVPLIETIKDSSSEEAYDKIISEIVIDEILYKVRSVLTEREFKVLLLRYGIDKHGNEINEGLTLREIGDELGLTREGVRQIEIAAKEKVKQLKNVNY